MARYEPAESVAFQRLGEPSREFLRFLRAPRAEDLGRADLFGPAAGQELAEAVDDALIGRALGLAWRRDAQRADNHLPRGGRPAHPDADRRHPRGFDRTISLCHG